MSELLICLCGALLASNSRAAVADSSFNRFTSMHVGVDLPGFGGVFRVDAPDVVAEHRFTAQSSADIDGVWLFYRTVGAPGSLRVRIYPGQPAHPTLPKLSTPISSGTVTPQAPSAAARWQHVSLTPAHGHPIATGDVLHLVLEPVPGATFDGDDYIEVVTTRERTPHQYLPSSISNPQPTSLQDDAFAFLYARGAASALDACVQRDSSAAYLPIFAVETAAGGLYGQPCDTHIETRIFGRLGFGQTLRFPSEATFDYVGMYVRGAGQAFEIGTPSDDLYLDIIELDLETGLVRPVLSKCVLAHRTDKLFKSRSHWWGRFIGLPLTLAGGPAKEYWLMLSSPASTGNGADAWIFSAEASGLAGLVPGTLPSFGMEDSRAVYADVRALIAPAAELDVWPVFDLEPSADAAFDLAYFGPGGPASIGILDEVLGSTVDQNGVPHGEFPISVAPGDTVHFDVIARNVGIDTALGGSLFARLRNVDSGAVVAGPLVYPPLTENNESSLGMSFLMPAQDLHLVLEVGHTDVVGGTGAAIVDHVTPWEIRAQ